MGIRVQKTLGWGVEFPPEEYDTLVNESYASLPFTKYLDYVEAMEKTHKLHGLERSLIRANRVDLTMISGHDVAKFIEDEHDEDANMAVIVLPVSEVNTWHRGGDAIDSYDVEEVTKNKIKYLRSGIFPWDGAYMDRTTGEPLLKEQTDVVHILRTMMNDPEGILDIGDELATSAGFASFEDFKDRVVPQVPSPVVNAVNYMNLFSDSSMVLKLRPMLATYWN